LELMASLPTIPAACSRCSVHVSNETGSVQRRVFE
jgi:hypothetical protein